MILSIDIGNSHIFIGLMAQRQVLYSMRCETNQNRTADEYAFYLLNFCHLYGVKPERIEGAILSSVVPKLRPTFSQAVAKAFQLELKIVGPGLKTGLDIRIEQPSELGSDLVVDAVAALDLFKPPLLVIDMGTATTCSYIDAERRYQGGMILPGLALSLEALTSKASLLKKVELKAPKHLVGKNTVECLQSGALYGQAALIDGLIDRFKREVSPELTVVTTGGLASEVVPYCHHEIQLEPELLLYGLSLLYERNL